MHDFDDDWNKNKFLNFVEAVQYGILMMMMMLMIALDALLSFEVKLFIVSVGCNNWVSDGCTCMTSMKPRKRTLHGTFSFAH
jgi:hypothetical protein